MCEKCSNSVENIYSEAGEAEEPCFNCDECRGYDGDTRKRDAYTDDCSRFRIDDYHARQAHCILQKRGTFMKKLVLEIPEENTCIGCSYQRQRKDVKEDMHHCAIFDTRADGKRPEICKKHTA